LREREKERELDLKGRVERNDAKRNGKEEQKRNEPGKGEAKEPGKEWEGLWLWQSVCREPQKRLPIELEIVSLLGHLRLRS
jgi:hypothetical protein